ncbi:MAG: hypothetical protein L6R41_000446 [Letrouitia leprolyta]|nr:MAG: hypothetical protein L6R41_000446 [Letrouitia leprolyta]
MHASMISRLAVVSALAASALAAPDQSTTPALQSLLSVSNLDNSQASEISTKFAADKSEYYSTLTTETGFPSAYSVIGAAIPDSARPLAAANPELFLASLVKASSQPDWFTSMPTPVQDFWESAGSHYIEMYTSEVDAARPIPSSLSSSLSSASSRLSSMSAALSSSSAAVSASASAAVLHGAAPASPILEQMTFVAAGVAIAAGLVGMAML